MIFFLIVETETLAKFLNFAKVLVYSEIRNKAISYNPLKSILTIEQFNNLTIDIKLKKIAFIPVRCGSKSIKFKNIKNFCGKPLVYWNLLALENSKNIDEIIVATDCNEIADTVKGFQFEKVKIYNRDAQNANDTASTEAVMLEFITKSSFKGDDLFVLVQATSPFTQTQHFDEAFELFTVGNFDSLLTCVRIKRFFWNENGTSANYNYQNRPRRQDFAGELMENGAFYINSIENIKKYNNRLSGKIGIYEMPEYTATEIDEESDWIVAESLMNKYILATEKAKRHEIKLFLTDVDGTLTDAGMYYSENGDELKKFSTYDGMGLRMLSEKGILTGIITSETRELNRRRAEKLKLNYYFYGDSSKLQTVTKLCTDLNISLQNVAYIGDDVNDFELLSNVGLAACPANSVTKIKNIQNIILLQKKGGEGAVREFTDFILSKI